MVRRTATVELIKRVLKDDFLSPIVDEYQITENVRDAAQCQVAVKIRHEKGDAPITIEGNGVGFVDAIFSGLMDHYAQEHESLKTIQLTGFKVAANIGSSRVKIGADAVGVVTLILDNSEGRSFEFEQSGRSLAAAVFAVVVEAVEFFVNSERAFIRVYRALCDARERGRADLVQSYASQLSELVNTTSYAEIIERIKQETL